MVAVWSSTASRSAHEEWLPPSVAARRVGVSPQTVRRLADGGQVRSVKTALGRLVDPVTLDELMASRNADDPLPVG